MTKLGIKNIEIWGAAPHYYAEYFNQEMLNKMKKEIRSHGLKLICLTPEQVTYPINIASDEKYLRELSINNHLKTLNHAEELECKMMLLTPGYGNIDQNKEEAWKRSADSIARIAEYAEKLGIIIALEHLSPASSNIINSARDLKRMLNMIKSPNLKAMFDFGQVGILKEKVENYFDLLGSEIVHIHVIDGTPGGHLAFGDGNLPLEHNFKMISKYGYKGYLSMEIADRRYFTNPQEADYKSINMYKKFIQLL
jgi:protein FrlC